MYDIEEHKIATLRRLCTVVSHLRVSKAHWAFESTILLAR